jgi:hypothetical protein
VPPILGFGLQSYGLPSFAVPLVVFVLAHVALGCMGMVRRGYLRSAKVSRAQ